MANLPPVACFLLLLLARLTQAHFTIPLMPSQEIFTKRRFSPHVTLECIADAFDNAFDGANGSSVDVAPMQPFFAAWHDPRWIGIAG